MDPTRRDSFQFRENNPLTQENELKEVTSDEAQKFMKPGLAHQKFPTNNTCFK